MTVCRYLQQHTPLTGMFQMVTLLVMKLQAHMDALGLKDKQVAADLVVARSFISQIRRGQREPSLKLAVAIERWSGGAVTPAELLVGN